MGLSIRLLLSVIVLSLNVACRSQTVTFDTVIRDVHVVDTQTGEVARDQAILIAQGQIVGIGPASHLQASAEHRVLDGEGGYAIPGLWDSHVHVLSDVDAALNRHLPLYIAFGVTHVRDMGSNVERLHEVREALETDPNRLAPKLLASGPLLMQFEQPWYGDIQRAVGQSGAGQAAVAELDAAGVDFLKAYTGLGRSAYLEVMAAAQIHNLPVDGHVPDSMGLPGVVDAGQRTIEHLDIAAFLSCAGGGNGPYGGYLGLMFTEGAVASYEMAVNFWRDVDWDLCGPALEALSARNGAVTPTLSMELRERERLSQEALSFIPEGSRDWCEQGLSMLDEVPPALIQAHREGLVSAFSQLQSRGVTVLAGTDAPNHCLAHGYSLSGELERMAEAGMPPAPGRHISSDCTSE